jgi:hypothetical protein
MYDYNKYLYNSATSDYPYIHTTSPQAEVKFIFTDIVSIKHNNGLWVLYMWKGYLVHGK